jgi:hypothetical protein
MSNAKRSFALLRMTCCHKSDFSLQYRKTLVPKQRTNLGKGCSRVEQASRPLRHTMKAFFSVKDNALFEICSQQPEIGEMSRQTDHRVLRGRIS